MLTTWSWPRVPGASLWDPELRVPEMGSEPPCQSCLEFASYASGEKWWVQMLVGWKVGVLVFKVEGDIRYIYIYHLYIYIYVSLMIIHISCFFKTAYPFAIFSWLPKRLGKKLSVWRRAKKGRRRLGNERSPNRSFLVGPLFHYLWETVWNWGQTRWEGIQKKWQRQQSTTKAFCQFPVDLHRDLQTIFGILPSDRTQLQCNCTGAESCTVRKNLARCCCWSCWWTSSWPLFGCVFDICALQDDCRWWMVNGWTMMIVIFRAVWLFFVYICYLLMFVIATIHVVVFLFDSHLKAFQTVLL